MLDLTREVGGLNFLNIVLFDLLFSSRIGGIKKLFFDLFLKKNKQ